MRESPSIYPRIYFWLTHRKREPLPGRLVILLPAKCIARALRLWLRRLKNPAMRLGPLFPIRRAASPPLLRKKPDSNLHFGGPNSKLELKPRRAFTGAKNLKPIYLCKPKELGRSKGGSFGSTIRQDSAY